MYTAHLPECFNYNKTKNPEPVFMHSFVNVPYVACLHMAYTVTQIQSSEVLKLRMTPFHALHVALQTQYSLVQPC
jgi:hypothetical protein